MDPKYVVECIESGTALPLLPRDIGLTGRAPVYVIQDRCVSIIDRKSRYLRKDADRFLTLLARVQEHQNRSLSGWVGIRTAPVCSKAKRFLEENQVQVHLLD
jgi:hypothetical protein